MLQQFIPRPTQLGALTVGGVLLTACTPSTPNTLPPSPSRQEVASVVCEPFDPAGTWEVQIPDGKTRCEEANRVQKKWVEDGKEQATVDGWECTQMSADTTERYGTRTVCKREGGGYGYFFVSRVEK